MNFRNVNTTRIIKKIDSEIFILSLPNIQRTVMSNEVQHFFFLMRQQQPKTLQFILSGYWNTGNSLTGYVKKYIIGQYQ